MPLELPAEEVRPKSNTNASAAFEAKAFEASVPKPLEASAVDPVRPNVAEALIAAEVSAENVAASAVSKRPWWKTPLLLLGAGAVAVLTAVAATRKCGSNDVRRRR